MNRAIAYAAVLSSALATSTAVAQETNTTFDEGSMLMLCVAPDAVGQTSKDDAVFEEAFPKLVENLQIRANEGKVIRAHFLTELKDGMFIVVGGENAAEAANNAVELQAESREIISQAIETTGVVDAPAPDYCRMIPIGPVAVLPMK